MEILYDTNKAIKDLYTALNISVNIPLSSEQLPKVKRSDPLHILNASGLEKQLQWLKEK